MRGLKRSTWALIALAALTMMTAALYFAGVIPYRVFIVHTGSMEPTIPSGSAVVVRTGQYHIGQPVTFSLYRSTVTHRLVGVDAYGNITTKGDANQTDDPQHPPKSNIIGEVVAAPHHVGWWLYYVGHTPTGALSIVLFVSCFWQANRLAKTFAEPAPAPVAVTS